MTFLSYYGLSFNPFDKQQVKEKDRFLSNDLQEMINRLDYLKDTRGIGLFTAGPGMGKSFGLRCFNKSLNPNLYHMEYICLSTVSVMEFYRQLCAVLGLEAKGGKPYLNNTLRKPVHEALRQRITVHYNFSGLSDAEVASYIRHKIACAAGSESIIDPAALSAVHSHSQGNPRVIDNLMTQALLLGQQLDKKVIDPELILAAVSDLNLL